MRKTVIILSLLCLHAVAMEAQRITHRFSDTPLTEALTTIAQKSHDYRVHFVENELGGFRITTFVRRKNALDAINQVIGTYPLKVTVDSTNIFVERIHRDWDNVCGTLVDNRRGSAVKYADIWLLNQQDSTTLTEGVSDGEGGFNIACREDSFLMRIWAIGYAPLMRHAQLGYIGVIPLEPNAIMLNEVKVQGLDVEHHGDRDVIYISDEMREGAVNTGDLLGKLQGFNYDRGRQKLSYYGKENIMVLADSLEKDLDYVTNLHHLRWNKLDVIPFPKGRYEGYDVLVNLHTREDYRGYDNNGWGHSNLIFGNHNMKNHVLGEGRWGESFTYTFNQWNFSVDYKGHFVQMDDDIRSKTEYPQNDYTEEVIANPDGSRNTRQYMRNHTLTTSLDHKFNTRSSIAFTYTLDWLSEDSISGQTMTRADLAGNPKDTVGLNSMYGEKGHSHTIAAFYRGGTGAWNYTADLQYNHEQYDDDYWLNRTSGFHTAEYLHWQHDNTLAKAELNRRFIGEKLYVALSYEHMWTHYQQLRQTTRERLTDYYLKQNTAKASLAYDISRRTAIAAALSVTRNSSTCAALCDRYLTWRGNFALTHHTKKNNIYHLTYTSETDNPKLWQVTSYTYLTDTLRLTEGNPLLHTSVSHTVQLDYRGHKGMGIWISETTSPRSFTEITALRQGEQGYYAATKPQDQKYNLFETGISFTKKWSRFHFYCELIYFQETGRYRLDEVTQSHKVSHFESNWFSSWDMKKVAKTRFTVAYNNDRFLSACAQGTGKQHFDQLWAELSKNYLHDKLHVSVLYIIPLHFISGYNNTLWESPAYTEWRSQRDMGRRTSNSLRLQISYSLNGGKVVKSYRRRKSND
ncbi:MAG: hypothetical protein LUC44_02875 [Prevotellaceae bacterium]|nr:hypothetical protein [Prevotellaceae bacterium]